MKKKISCLILVILTLGIFSSCVIANTFSTKAQIENNEKKLYAGITTRNIQIVKEALEDGANINKLDILPASKENPITLSLVGSPNDNIATYLLENGADPNYISIYGYSLLMFSAYNNDPYFCKLLLQHGAKIDTEDSNGYTALEAIFSYPRQSTENDINEVITSLLDAGAKIKPLTLKAALQGEDHTAAIRYAITKRILEGLINAGFKSELDPALEAAMLGDSSKLNELIKANKIQKNDEKKILFYTAAFGSSETLELLKNIGLDLEATDDHNNYTPLIIASHYGNLDVVKYLLTQGINIEKRSSHDEKSALDYAIENKQYNVAKYLIKQGMDLKPFKVWEGTVDVLEEAAKSGSLDMVKFIIDNGYELNDDNIRKALASACEKDQIKVVKYLLDKGIDVNKEYNGSPMLYYCKSLDSIKLLVEYGAKVNDEKSDWILLNDTDNIDILKYLIEKGANVNSMPFTIGSKAQAIKGSSVLMDAIWNGNLDKVKLLVENGADLEYKYEKMNNDTAIIHAAEDLSKCVLEYLIQHNANINYQNTNGETALMRAVSKNNLDSVRILLDNKADTSLKDNDGHTALDIAKANKYSDIADLLENKK